MYTDYVLFLNDQKYEPNFWCFQNGGSFQCTVTLEKKKDLPRVFKGGVCDNEEDAKQSAARVACKNTFPITRVMIDLDAVKDIEEYDIKGTVTFDGYTSSSSSSTNNQFPDFIRVHHSPIKSRKNASTVYLSICATLQVDWDHDYLYLVGKDFGLLADTINAMVGKIIAKSCTSMKELFESMNEKEEKKQ